MFAKGYIAGNIKTKGIKMRFSLIKREPSFFFENMHEDLQRFLKDTFGDIETTYTNKPFERTFRPAVEIKETKDGGYIIVGNTSTQAFVENYIVNGGIWIKCNSKGEIEWVNSINVEYSNSIIRSVAEIEEGRFILAGEVINTFLDKEFR